MIETSALAPRPAVTGEAEQRFRVVFEGSDTAVMVLDLDGRIVDANPAAERATGRSRAELAGRLVGTLVVRPDVADHRRRWRDLVTGRVDHDRLAVALQHADGTATPMCLATTVVRDTSGRPTRAVAVVHAAPARAAARDARRPSTAEAGVLVRLAAGQSIREIAEELRLTRRGVDHRIAQLRRKLRAEGQDGTPATTAALVARGVHARLPRRVGVATPDRAGPVHRSDRAATW